MIGATWLPFLLMVAVYIIRQLSPSSPVLNSWTSFSFPFWILPPLAVVHHYTRRCRWAWQTIAAIPLLHRSSPNSPFLCFSWSCLFIWKLIDSYSLSSFIPNYISSTNQYLADCWISAPCILIVSTCFCCSLYNWAPISCSNDSSSSAQRSFQRVLSQLNWW